MPIFDVPIDELRRRTSIKWSRWEDDVIPMFVAEMDVRLPQAVTDALTTAIAEGDTGYPEQPIYQEAYAAFAHWRWGWDIDASRFHTSGDVMQGIAHALVASTRPGDRVVFNPPAYPPIRHTASDTGRVPVEVPLVGERLDFEALERAFADGATAYILCSPHNPTGTVHTRAELERVAQLAAAHDVTVISDEVHAPFNGPEFTPYLDVAGVGKAFTVSSGAKAFNLAGLKAGLIIASEQSLDTLNNLPEYVHEATSHLGAIAHSAGLNGARDWIVQVQDEIAANKRLFARLIAERIPQLRYVPSEGTYLAWLDCTPLGLDEPGEFFHRDARVRFNFGAEFAPENQQWIRANLATSPEVIEEAVNRMALSVNRLDP